jgi:hypothetical protein
MRESTGEGQVVFDARVSEIGLESTEGAQELTITVYFHKEYHCFSSVIRIPASPDLLDTWWDVAERSVRVSVELLPRI